MLRLLGLFIVITQLSFAQQVSETNYEMSKACFNTPFDDFGVRKIAGRLFLISGSIDSGRIVNKDFVTGRPFTDVYEVDGCKIKDAYLLNANASRQLLISSPQNDGNLSGDAFGKVIFFSANSFDSLGDKTGLFYVKRLANGWSNPFYFPYNSKNYNINHPCYDSYTQQLFFSANMPGGKGGNDLYKVTFDGNSFGKVIPLTEINSEKDDVFPAFQDGKLYFSSNREGTKGGLDIFCFVDNQITHLSEVVNSIYDDFDYYPLGQLSAFMSTNRGEKGKNDEAFYVTESSIPLHELNTKSYLSALNLIEENLRLYDKLNVSSEFKNQLLVLKTLESTLQNGLISLENLNTELNQEFPVYLANTIKETVHTDENDYNKKDVSILTYAMLMASLSTTHDSVQFVNEYTNLLAYLKVNYPDPLIRMQDQLSQLYADGLLRIRQLEITSRSMNELVSLNESTYYTALTDKSSGISEEQWNQLAATQAGLTKKLALLAEEQRISDLDRKIKENERILELKMSEFLSTMNEDKFNSFYQLDSLFNAFKVNPSKENALKLAEAFKSFNPSVLEEMANIIEVSSRDIEKINQLKQTLVYTENKFNKEFEKEFIAFSTKVHQGETIGLKEELVKFQNTFDIVFSDDAQKILNNFIFSESDVVVKFGSFGNILFAFDSYSLTPIAKSQLDSILILVKKSPATKFLLNGYTDNLGPIKYNLKLSKNRANSVYNYLVRRGLPKKNIVRYYFGEKFPSVDNSTTEGRKLNRRVELKMEGFVLQN